MMPESIVFYLGWGYTSQKRQTLCPEQFAFLLLAELLLKGSLTFRAFPSAIPEEVLPISLQHVILSPESFFLSPCPFPSPLSTFFTSISLCILSPGASHTWEDIPDLGTQSPLVFQNCLRPFVYTLLGGSRNRLFWIESLGHFLLSHYTPPLTPILPHILLSNAGHNPSCL